MYTEVIVLTNIEYTEITSKAEFLMQSREGEGIIEIVASDTNAPAATTKGIVIDSRQGLQRSFAGVLWGKSLGVSTTVVVLEGTAEWDAA